MTPAQQRRFGFVLALLALLAACAASGCCSVKVEHVEALERAIHDARQGVFAKPGLEDAVRSVWDEEDRLLSAMKRAHR